jgi:predicted adenylyl cyclase CyaB
MKTEIEVKFLNINVDELTTKLTQLWGKLTKPQTEMKRIAFDLPWLTGNQYARIRDEWDHITCTYKKVSAVKDANAVSELEIQVNDFETTRLMLVAFWLKQKAYQETRRQIREYLDCQITIDERPWLKPFTEIEWPNEQIIIQVANKLWFHRNAAVFGAVDEIYHIELWYPHHVINQIPEIIFAKPLQQYQAS